MRESRGKEAGGETPRFASGQIFANMNIRKYLPSQWLFEVQLLSTFKLGFAKKMLDE